MATSTIPKSEFRRNDNIIHGYGEVPAVETDKGIAWGLPGKAITHCPNIAREFARKLDLMIRTQLAHSPRAMV